MLLGCKLLMVELVNKGVAFEHEVVTADADRFIPVPADKEDVVLRALAFSVTTRWVAGDPPIMVPEAPTDAAGKDLATRITF